MFAVIITHSQGFLISQAFFDTLQEAQQYFNNLVRDKPFEQVLIRLIEKRNVYQSFLIDAIRIGATLRRRKQSDR